MRIHSGSTPDAYREVAGHAGQDRSVVISARAAERINRLAAERRRPGWDFHGSHRRDGTPRRPSVISLIPGSVRDQGHNQYPRKRDRATIDDMAHTAASGTPTPAARPLVGAHRTRRSSDRILLGVAGGFARRWCVDATLLRAAVGLLALAGGVGVALYVVGVALSDPRPATNEAEPAPAPNLRRNLAVAVATLASLIAAHEVGLWPGTEVMVPAAIVAIAVVVIWAPGAPAVERDGGSARRGSTAPLVRWVLGAILASPASPRCPIAPAVWATWVGRLVPSPSPSPASA